VSPGENSLLRVVQNLFNSVFSVSLGEFLLTAYLIEKVTLVGESDLPNLKEVTKLTSGLTQKKARRVHQIELSPYS